MHCQKAYVDASCPAAVRDALSPSRLLLPRILLDVLQQTLRQRLGWQGLLVVGTPLVLGGQSRLDFVDTAMLVGKGGGKLL